MPVPAPKKDETQSEFMSRCVPVEIGTGENKRPQEQAVAICLRTWRDAHKKELGELLDGIADVISRNLKTE